jgi:hypothetical protein
MFADLVAYLRPLLQCRVIFGTFLREKSLSYEAGNMVLVKQNVFWLPLTKQGASKKCRLSTDGFSDAISYF